MTILLVDDDNDDIEIFGEVIQQLDKEINLLTAHNGVEALSFLQDITPDVIFLDINMPLMNGLECLQEIRKRYSSNRFKVIMYSTSKDTPTCNNCMLLGATYLAKPDSYDVLKSSLQNVLYEG